MKKGVGFEYFALWRYIIKDLLKKKKKKRKKDLSNPCWGGVVKYYFQQ